MNRNKGVIKEQGRSQKWLSKLIDNRPVILNNYCNNKSQPKLEELSEMADRLNFSVKEVLVEED